MGSPRRVEEQPRLSHSLPLAARALRQKNFDEPRRVGERKRSRSSKRLVSPICRFAQPRAGAGTETEETVARPQERRGQPPLLKPKQPSIEILLTPFDGRLPCVGTAPATTPAAVPYPGGRLGTSGVLLTLSIVPCVPRRRRHLGEDDMVIPPAAGRTTAPVPRAPRPCAAPGRRRRADPPVATPAAAHLSSSRTGSIPPAGR
jgi:hypothetical protein